jgi:hypothetical protein
VLLRRQARRQVLPAPKTHYPLEPVTHLRVAFAAHLFEALAVDHTDVAPTVTDQPRHLELVGNQADAGTMHAQYLGYELLREPEVVAVNPVMGDKHPARKPRHHRCWRLQATDCAI